MWVPIVISNKVGIHAEVTKNKPGIIVDTNPINLLQGMEASIDNQTLRGEIAKNGKKLVSDYYNIHKIADRMINEFEEILTNA